MSQARRPVLVLLILALFVSGCTGRQVRTRDQSPTPVVRDIGDQPGRAPHHTSSAAPTPGAALATSDDADSLETVGSRANARAAKWVAVGLIIAAVVILDVLLLPACHRRHNAFPCTRAVIVIVD